MVKRIGGNRRKTRKKFKKDIQDKGKISITRYLQEFETGDPVVLKADPSVHEGLYFPRFHGKAGIVDGKQGKCYQVVVKDHKKAKTIIVHPVHLLRG
ncbi:50S ribosomal protein L21e [Candidatus Woesearchaeota archaeon CG11_big_fil_rev_8_21_14_0_20_43_8]|nr:MAG: 50S ribosomal protein L21e [Candidatus Woesearchaeota archaeon CG11_big_fil_rev_8_21_14_0_20_43_8]PIO06794.1 MAG: 50S ribosomal protein L21e [Candidatus Woesearchaeota archaeon CG08_land_8_20_14_0_20_43_7]